MVCVGATGLTSVVALTEKLQEPEQVFGELVVLKNLGAFLETDELVKTFRSSTTNNF